MTIDQKNLKMKTNLLLTTLFLLYATCSNATIYRVNNNPEVDADFTNITDAVAGASNGDTLHIEASNTYYAGASNINKKLTFIGPGVFVTEHDSTQALGKQAIITGEMRIYASDSVTLKGLVFMGQIVINSSSANNVTIEGNYFVANANTDFYFVISTYDCTNVSIRENWMIHELASPSYLPRLILFTGSASGILIENNYISVSDEDIAIEIRSNASAIVRNNIINGGLVLNNTEIKNNIYLGGDSLNIAVSCTEDYNMCNGTQFTGPNSIQSVNMSTVFQNYPITSEEDAELAGGSPALNAGDGGTDCGMYGGAKPYRYPNMPEVPSIYEFTGPAEAPPVGTISISFESKSHN